MELNISLAPEILFKIGSFPVSNSFFWMVVVSISLMILILTIRYKFKQVPGRTQAAFEILIEGGLDFVQSIIEDKDIAKKVFPLVFTLFLFIMLANLITFIPGSAVVLESGEGKVSLFRAVMSDYGIVIVMTLVAVITAQIVAIISFGPFGYLGKYFNFSGMKEFFSELFRGKLKFGLLAQGFLDIFLGLMDIVGEIAKIVSLSFRLFGNIFAGEVLGMVMLFLMPWFLPLPFQFLSLLTAVVQAFVFAVLTLMFISLALKIDDEDLNEKATV
ncbi:MAG: F0F1 ATP synthase subunit A [Candidatus Moranbacteria bacterium]|nr:F0F1 ATP synthase subunit A [Candidatus Moranbacteria bacterium]